MLILEGCLLKEVEGAKSNHYRDVFYLSLSTLSVGSPIQVEKVTSPSDEQITQLHALYTKELKQLFDNNRDKYGVPSETKLIIQ